MPTILRAEGFRFFFFSNELQEPPHVHVERGDGYAKFWLTPIAIAYSERLTRAELRRLRELLAENERLLLGRWRAYFGR